MDKYEEAQALQFSGRAMKRIWADLVEDGYGETQAAQGLFDAASDRITRSWMLFDEIQAEDLAELEGRQ